MSETLPPGNIPALPRDGVAGLKAHRSKSDGEGDGRRLIDDPISMIRCTNKVFLMELLGSNQVATPPTVLLADAGNLPRAMDELGLPLVVRIPDGWGHPLAAPPHHIPIPVWDAATAPCGAVAPIWGSWWAAPPTARRKLILELNGEDSACCRLKSGRPNLQDC